MATTHARVSGVRCSAALGLLLLMAGVLGSVPALTCLGLVVSTASLLQHWLPGTVAIPAGALGMTFAAIAAGTVAGAIGVDLLAHPSLLACGYLAFGAVAALRAWRHVPWKGPTVSGPHWWALIPSVVAAGTGVVQGLSIGAVAQWAFYGTDLIRHVTLLSALQRDGHIDYGANSYPQGLHMLGALVSAPYPSRSSAGELLAHDLRLYAALTWFALALFLWAGAVVTALLAARLDLPRAISSVAGAALGAGAMMTNSFVFAFVFMGAAPALVAVVALWAVPVAGLIATSRTKNLPALALTSCVAVALVSHLWQALVVVPPSALIAVALPVRRREMASTLRSRAGSLATLRVLPFAAVSLAVAAGPLLAVQGDGGLSVAATPGRFPGKPWLLLVLALVATAWLITRMRGACARTLLGSQVGFLVCFSCLVGGTGDLDVGAWYPLKAAWLATLFLSPGLALWAAWFGYLGAARVLRVLGRTGRAAFVLRSAASGLVLAIAFSFWLPYLLGQQSVTVQVWRAMTSSVPRLNQIDTSATSAQRYLIATTYGRRFRDAVVVPYFVGYSAVFDQQSTRLVSEILTSLTGQPELSRETDDPCDAVQRLSDGRRAVIISRLSRAMVRHDLSVHGCPGRASVIRVPGSIRDVAFARATLAGRDQEP